MKEKPLTGIKILVVDDEDALREILKSALQSRGAIVTDASNGKDAFELIKKNEFQFVISDIRMPGGDGVTLLKDVQGMSTRRPKVVLITGFADIEITEARQIGALALLQKPFTRDKLFDLILANA
jgi:DNA-binding NtrC family response regulator